jgi:SAM-dependent methyltransferase
LRQEKDGTIRTYNAINELYDAETRDFWDRFPLDIVRKFVELLPSDEILDLGSGPGRDAVILRNHGLNVTCVDGSENMVNMTARLGFNSVLSDLRVFDSPDKKYHGIWAYSSLIHLNFDEAKKLVGKLSDILKDGGVLFLGLIQGDGHDVINAAGSSFTRYFEYYHHEKIMALVENSSFRLVFHDSFKPGNQVYLNYIFSK